MENDSKIKIDSANFQKFALSDNEREVHVGRKFGVKLAIAGRVNKHTRQSQVMTQK